MWMTRSVWTFLRSSRSVVISDCRRERRVGRRLTFYPGPHIVKAGGVCDVVHNDGGVGSAIVHGRLGVERGHHISQVR